MSMQENPQGGSGLLASIVASADTEASARYQDYGLDVHKAFVGGVEFGADLALKGILSDEATLRRLAMHLCTVYSRRGLWPTNEDEQQVWMGEAKAAIAVAMNSKATV